MHRLSTAGAGLLMAAALAACSPPPPLLAPLRNTGARISSAALFDPARFGGDWIVVQSGTPGCMGAKQSWIWDAKHGRYDLTGVDCTGLTPSRLNGEAELTGPGGRLSAIKGYGQDVIWVLWFDQDYRVAALGTPSGSWGVILVRPGHDRLDLINAAREVMEFNGYDTSRIGP
ncbi:lipocalin/fatty acid-binding family protein [Rhodobacter maris]|uniref:Apolipoprotein D and lipocalin family protein n=1 Tax=Rhodobacter maris TaxID=446682 RepID=A0A285SBB9_9RHOB|nr:lipocalin [Rhodobacter maris]SOC02756.1 apolipoprotein D and lipocalin family protein [Rhodobacter maris]